MKSHVWGKNKTFKKGERVRVVGIPTQIKGKIIKDEGLNVTVKQNFWGNIVRVPKIYILRESK